MPSAETQPLFDEAKRLGIGFHLGYAELTPDGHRFNTAILVDSDGTLLAKYRKVHIPGHEEHEPQRPFQHLERRYFEESAEGFSVWRAFGASWVCAGNDGLGPTYPRHGFAKLEMILHRLQHATAHGLTIPRSAQAFHNHLVMQAGAYQTARGCRGVAKGGTEKRGVAGAPAVIAAVGPSSPRQSPTR